MRFVKTVSFLVACALSTLAAAETSSGALTATQSQANSPAEGAPIKLEAASAVGGEKNTEAGAVFLTAAMDLKESVRWNFSSPLPAGTWKVNIDFTDKTGTAKNQVIGFTAEHSLRIECDRLGIQGRQSIFVVTSVPTNGVYYKKNYQRNQTTAGIRSITIERAATLDPAERWFLDCAVANGNVILPISLVPGHIRASTATAASLTWKMADGTSFETPSGTRVYVSCEKPVAGISVKGSDKAITVERYPLVPVPDMPVTSKELIKVTDAKLTETGTLTLIGGTTGSPSVAIFPFGCKHALFTTWDDGQLADVTVAEQLKKYGIRGTFVMNRHSAMIPQLSKLEALGMEIGSHSWSHPHYEFSGYARCLAESVNMRLFLEGTLGHPVISFCYPFGYQAAYDEKGDYVLRSLIEAGYWFARTTRGASNRIDDIKEPLTLGPDTHFNAGAERIGTRFNELMAKEGTVYHIWGHSYETAGAGMATLEDVLKAVGGKPHVWYTTGGELFVWRWMRLNTRIEQSTSDSKNPAFLVTRPWLHPYLRTVPLTVQIPAGIQEIIWNDKRLPVISGTVDLPW